MTYSGGTIFLVVWTIFALGAGIFTLLKRRALAEKVVQRTFGTSNETAVKNYMRQALIPSLGFIGMGCFGLVMLITQLIRSLSV